MSCLYSCAPLVLHFDVNKTIIMADPAKGVSTESMLNSLLSETVWGAVIIPGYNKQTSATGHGAVDTIMRTPLGLDGRTLRPEDWVLLSPKPHPYPPTLTETHNIAFDGATEGRDHDDFIVPIDYAMQRLKDHERSRHHIHEKGDDLVNSSATGHERDIDVEDIVIITFAEYIENILRLSRKDRNALKTRFAMPGGMGGPCHADNGPQSNGSRSSNSSLARTGGVSDTGSCYPELQRLREMLQAPGRPATGGADVDTNTGCSVADEDELFPDGYLAMLPSFFSLVARLHILNIDFRIVFRTFGIDIPRIAREFNMFCSGMHPLCSRYLPEGVRMDGSGGSVDRRLHLPHRSCKIIRGAMLQVYSARSDARDVSSSLASMCVAHVSDEQVTKRTCFMVTLAWDECVYYLVRISFEQTITTSFGPNALNNILSKWFSHALPPKDILPHTAGGTTTTNTSLCVGPYASAAIQDDFTWWDHHGESEDSGKLMVVNRYLDDTLKHEHRSHTRSTAMSCEDSSTLPVSITIPTSDTATISPSASTTTTTAVTTPCQGCNITTVPLMQRAVQLFFDDNIERDRAHIVDVRSDHIADKMHSNLTSMEGSVRSASSNTPSTNSSNALFEPIPFEESRMKYIARIDPYRAIVDDKYYIDLLRNVLNNRGILGIVCPQL